MCHVFYVSYFRFGSYVSCSSLLVCIYVVACFPSVPDCLCYPCVTVHSWVFVPPWLPYVTVSGAVDFSDLFFFLPPLLCATYCLHPDQRDCFLDFGTLASSCFCTCSSAPSHCVNCVGNHLLLLLLQKRLLKNAFSGQNNCNQTAHSRLLFCVMCSWSNEFNFFFHNFCHFRCGHWRTSNRTWGTLKVISLDLTFLPVDDFHPQSEPHPPAAAWSVNRTGHSCRK